MHTLIAWKASPLWLKFVSIAAPDVWHEASGPRVPAFKQLLAGSRIHLTCKGIFRHLLLKTIMWMLSEYGPLCGSSAGYGFLRDSQRMRENDSFIALETLPKSRMASQIVRDR